MLLFLRLHIVKVPRSLYDVGSRLPGSPNRKQTTREVVKKTLGVASTSAACVICYVAKQLAHHFVHTFRMYLFEWMFRTTNIVEQLVVCTSRGAGASPPGSLNCYNYFRYTFSSRTLRYLCCLRTRPRYNNFPTFLCLKQEQHAQL